MANGNHGPRPIAYMTGWAIAFWFAVAVAALGQPGTATNMRPSDLRAIRSCEVYDGDTLTKCEIELGWDVVLTNKTIRVADVDACEVSRVRQTVEVSDAEIAKGRECRDKLRALGADGKWFVRPLGESVYGRLQGEVWLYRGGKWLNVAEWIRSNGYERK